MVRIAFPPPLQLPAPQFHDLAANTYLVRIFDPSRYGAIATSFRSVGPIYRFDHQRVALESDRITADPERAIYYAALTLQGCLVEMYGDTRIIDCGQRHVARVRLVRTLHLLDLRRNGAMLAGSVAALSKIADYSLSQAWSRYFYENMTGYGQIDGLIYLNAHNDDDAIALYERAATALESSPDQTLRLDDTSLRPAILLAARENGLIVGPVP